MLIFQCFSIMKSAKKPQVKIKNLKITFKMFYFRICANPPMQTNKSAKSYSIWKKIKLFKQRFIWNTQALWYLNNKKLTFHISIWSGFRLCNLKILLSTLKLFKWSLSCTGWGWRILVTKPDILLSYSY